MHKMFLQLAALLGAVSVALGAFAAHGLKKVAPADALNIFETAVRYQFYHVFGLLATAILFRDFGGKWMLWSGYLFIVGIILFCGSLYLLTYFKTADKMQFSWVGAVTPFGGLAFIAGWLCMFVGLLQSK